MPVPYFPFWGKPREPEIGKSVDKTTQDRGKNTNTYAFLISIVTGNDYTQPREVEALALYNESCTCNYISGRFARDQLQISDERGYDMEGDCTLVWVCTSLGRYKQRSVFWIAPNADFDLLFGEEDEFNARSCEDKQFNWGIESGILSEKSPERKPRKTFIGGINDEFLLPVEQLNTSDSSRRTQTPSLAEIKLQLTAQLDCTPERRRKHLRKKALNIYNPLFSTTSEDSRLCRDGNTKKPATFVLESSHSLRGDEGASTVRENSVGLDDGSTFKGNKRCFPNDHHSALAGDLAECSPRSLKLRHMRLRPTSIHAPLDKHVSNGVGTVSCTSETPYHPEIPYTNQKPDSESSDGRQTLSESIKRPKSFVASGAEGILFSGMDRECSLDQTVSDADSSISLPSPKSCTTSESDRIVPHSEPSREVSKTSKKSEKREARKRRSKRKVSNSLNIGDVKDIKFNEFWTRDAEAGNWYHFDESTNRKIWYEPPPSDD